MKVKVGAPLKGSIVVKKVKAVRQRATEFDLDFTDGTTAKIVLEDQVSSVMLRDHKGVMEYDD